MYTNCRASSLLEWKIIVDQDAEDYLIQSLLKRERWKDPKTNAQTGHDKNNRNELLHATKSTHYRKGERHSYGEDTEQLHNIAKTSLDTKGNQEETGMRLRNKLTRKIILDMIETGHLTMEEGEVELKELETKQRANKERPKEKSPREKWEKHANIALHTGPNRGQRMEKIAPKNRNSEDRKERKIRQEKPDKTSHALEEGKFEHINKKNEEYDEWKETNLGKNNQAQSNNRIINNGNWHSPSTLNGNNHINDNPNK